MRAVAPGYSVSIAIQSCWFISYAQSVLHERRPSPYPGIFILSLFVERRRRLWTRGPYPLCFDGRTVDQAALVHVKAVLTFPCLSILRSFIPSPFTLTFSFSRGLDAESSTDTSPRR